MAANDSDKRVYEAVTTGGRRSSPAALRNRDTIADVLRDWLRPQGKVLEIASGTGEHALHFATLFPHLTWQPSDPHEDALASIEAWRSDGLANFLAPIKLDVREEQWPIDEAHQLICMNMIHISEWAATLGLFQGSSRLLPVGAPLILYGPYIEDDVETAPSNLAFDQSLKARNPAWGLRNVAAVDVVAAQSGFVRSARVAMPANNLMLLYRKS